MKLAEITVKQKSRWLAEKMEPRTSLPDVDEDTRPFPRFSPRLVWVTASIHKYDVHWEPRNMTEPEMTRMLKQELVRQYGAVAVWVFSFGRCRVDRPNQLEAQMVTMAMANSEGEAVLDAAMLANGFVETGGQDARG